MSEEDNDQDFTKNKESAIERSLYGLLNSIYCYGQEEPREIRTMGFEKDVDKLMSHGLLPINIILEYIFEYRRGGLITEPFDWAVKNINNVDIVDTNGNSPLHIIAQNLKKIGNSQKHNMAQDLIKKGFNPCIKNNNGVTPIEIALSVCPKFKVTDWEIDWDINCEYCRVNVPKYKKKVRGAPMCTNCITEVAWGFCNECKKPYCEWCKNDNHKFEGEDDEGCAWAEIVESTLLRDGTKETHNWKMYKYECEKCDFTISPRLWESDSDSDSDSSWGI